MQALFDLDDGVTHMIILSLAVALAMLALYEVYSRFGRNCAAHNRHVQHNRLINKFEITDENDDGDEDDLEGGRGEEVLEFRSRRPAPGEDPMDAMIIQTATQVAEMARSLEDHYGDAFEEANARKLRLQQEREEQADRFTDVGIAESRNGPEMSHSQSGGSARVESFHA